MNRSSSADPLPERDSLVDKLSPAQRYLYLTIGWVFVGLGIIGLALPLVPQVPFFLVSLWAFSRSSRRFEHWLLHHKILGPGLRRFREYRVVPWLAKVTSWTGMCVTFGLSLWSGFLPSWALVAEALVLLACAAFIASFPSHAPASTLPDNAPPKAASRFSTQKRPSSAPPHTL